MAFNGRVRAVLVRAHERVMSAPRSTVFAAAFVASVLVVVACAVGVLSSRHAVTVADSAAGGGEGRVVVSWRRAPTMAYYGVTGLRVALSWSRRVSRCLYWLHIIAARLSVTVLHSRPLAR